MAFVGYVFETLPLDGVVLDVFVADAEDVQVEVSPQAFRVVGGARAFANALAKVLGGRTAGTVEGFLLWCDEARRKPRESATCASPAWLLSSTASRPIST